MGHQPFRFEPAGPVGAYRTYGARMDPADVAGRPSKIVGCDHPEIACPNYLNGWKTEIDRSSELGQEQYDYLLRCGREYVVGSPADARMAVFIFTPGQQCFTEHRVYAERPMALTRRDGDHRADLGNAVRFTRTQDFLDDFGENQQAIADRVKREVG